MDDYLEIDLRKIIKTILSNWYWVILTAALFGLVTFVLFTIWPEQPALYQAQTQITLTDPRYPKLIDQLTEPIVPPRISNAAVEKLFKNEAIIVRLFELWDCPQDHTCTLETFIDDHLEVRFPEEEEKGLIKLTVMATSPDNAITMANTWGELAIEMDAAAFYYADQNAILLAETAAQLTDLIDEAVFQASAQLTQLEMFLAFTEPHFEEAAQQLIDFEEDNNLEALRKEFNDQLANREDTLQAIRNLEAAQEDIQTLLTQLAFEPDDASLDTSFRMQYLQVLNKVFGISVPMGLVITEEGQAIDTRTVAEFVLMLENLQESFIPRYASLEEKQASINSEILALQTQIQSLEKEKTFLNLAYQTLSDDYETIFRIYQEVLFYEAVAEPAEVTLVEFAATTTLEQTGSTQNVTRNTAIGIVVGGMLGVAGIITVDWWRAGEDEE